MYEHSKPERSDTADRNTNLITVAIREEANTAPYSGLLIHAHSKELNLQAMVLEANKPSDRNQRALKVRIR